MFPASSTIDQATPSTAELFIGWHHNDPSMFSHLSDEELLKLASLLNRVLPLVTKARHGEISSEERKGLEADVKNLLDLLGVATPLGGKLAAYIASRKPGPILKAAGIADAVDTFLELMARMSQIIVRAEFDSRILGGALTTSPPVFDKKDESKTGFLCEALGRLWLKEVQAGVWSDARYVIIEKRDMDTLAVVKDVDALAEERVGDRLNLYVAEIKRTFTQNHVEKIKDTIDILRKDYSDRRMNVDKTIKSIRIITLWVIDFSKGPKPSIEDELRKRLTNKIEQEIRFIYLDEIKETCRKVERVGHTLLKSIELLEKIGVIGYGPTG
jgi:hypothetical protein